MGFMDEVHVCVNCESEVDTEEGYLMVDNHFLCDSFCLGEFLQSHGLAVLHQGEE